MRLGKTKRCFAVLCFFAVMITLIIFGVFFQKIEASAEDITFSVNTEDLVGAKRGDTVNIPTGKFGEYEAEVRILSPDGKTHIGKSLYLETNGEYILQYFADIDGKLYMEEVKFSVENCNYSFTGNKSAGQYCTKEDSPIKRAGLKTSIAPGESFQYNRAVNLYDFSGENPAVAFTIAPQTLGRFDSKQITIALTDVYDSENKVEVRFFLDGDPSQTFWNRCLARANGQAWKGWDNTQAKPFLWTNAYGFYYTLYPSDVCNMNGFNMTNILERQALGVWVNPTTNELYVACLYIQNDVWAAGMVIDLDDYSYQDEDFTGFTTGEVLISASCDDYTSALANVFFLNIGREDLSASDTKDEEPPTIVADMLGYNEENLPVGLAGNEYPVFDAMGKDVNSGGYVYVEKRVFFNYSKPMGEYKNENLGNYDKEISVIDGKFTPSAIGKYAICYLAKDYFGNSMEKVLIVDVGNTTQNITELELNEGYVTELQAGNNVKLATVKKVSGGTGEIAIDYSVKLNEEEISLSGNAVKGFEFIPIKPGIYDVEITAKDLLGVKKIVKYSIKASEQTQTAFVSDPLLPKYIVTNVPLVLPKLYGMKKDGSEELAKITVYDANGKREYCCGEEITFSSLTGSVKIEYSFGNNVRAYTIPTISVKTYGEIRAENYIVGENINAVTESTGIKISSLCNSSAEYANPLLLSNGNSIDLQIEDLGSSFKTFEVALCDIENVAECTRIRFCFNGTGIDIYVNDKLSVKNWKDTFIKNIDVNLYFDNSSCAWVLNGTLKLNVNQTFYGDDFTGFSSKKVYLSVGFDDVITQASVLIKKIGNQPMGLESRNDNRLPFIELIGSYGTLVREVGDVINLLPAIGGDVLSPYTKVSVSVTYDYDFVSGIDGVFLNEVDCSVGNTHQVMFEKVGVYTISYVATDWNNKRYTQTFLIRVSDLTAPEIFVEGIKKIYESGEVILPEIKVNDNQDEKVTLIVTAKDPRGKIIYINDGKFNADKQGKYKLIIMAMDSFGNTKSLIYEIEVR